MANQVCQGCGGAVDSADVDQGKAGRWAGQMLCATCYAKKRGGDGASEKPAPAAAPSGADREESISLEIESSAGTAGATKIQTFGQQSTQLGAHRSQFKRPLAPGNKGASRVKTFHSKIAIESIEFMDNAINEWLDDNADIEVKFVTTTIGLMAGKHPEPNLIMNIWY